MRMYRKNLLPKVEGMKVNQSYEGESIEAKIRRIVDNKEPIRDGAPLLYTERSEGVRAETDIRTDRFDVAIDAMDAGARSIAGKRENRIMTEKGMVKGENGEWGPAPKAEGGSGGADSTAGTTP